MKDSKRSYWEAIAIIALITNESDYLKIWHFYCTWFASWNKNSMHGFISIDSFLDTLLRDVTSTESWKTKTKVFLRDHNKALVIFFHISRQSHLLHCWSSFHFVKTNCIINSLEKSWALIRPRNYSTKFKRPRGLYYLKLIIQVYGSSHFIFVNSELKLFMRGWLDKSHWFSY